VDSTFAGFRDVFDKKTQCNDHFCRSKFALFWWDQLVLIGSHTLKFIEKSNNKKITRDVGVVDLEEICSFCYVL
jgi:hypothetical protein